MGRFNAILSWLKQTEEAKEAAAKLETEIAAVTAVNESMRMTHEANLAELADQYDILQIQLSERLTNEQKVCDDPLAYLCNTMPHSPTWHCWLPSP